MQILNNQRRIESTPDTNDALMKTPKTFLSEVTPDKPQVNSSNFKTP